jgi:hypothetical protein
MLKFWVIYFNRFELYVDTEYQDNFFMAFLRKTFFYKFKIYLPQEWCLAFVHVKQHPLNLF